MLQMNLQYFGGRGSSGGNNPTSVNSRDRLGTRISTKDFGELEVYSAFEYEGEVMNYTLRDVNNPNRIMNVTPEELNKLQSSGSLRIPKSSVEVNESEFKAYNGRPSGQGNWAFYFGNREEPVFYSGSYASAKKQAIEAAAKRGIKRVRLGT